MFLKATNMISIPAVNLFIRGPQDQPLDLFKDSQDSTYTHGYESLQRRDIKSAKGRGTWGKVWRNPNTSFQESSPARLPQDTLNSPNHNCDMWDVVGQGSSLETQCSGFLLRTGHTGTFSLHKAEFQTPRWKAIASSYGSPVFTEKIFPLQASEWLFKNRFSLFCGYWAHYEFKETLATMEAAWPCLCG